MSTQNRKVFGCILVKAYSWLYCIIVLSLAVSECVHRKPCAECTTSYKVLIGSTLRLNFASHLGWRLRYFNARLFLPTRMRTDLTRTLYFVRFGLFTRYKKQVCPFLYNGKNVLADTCLEQGQIFCEEGKSIFRGT